MIHNIHYTYVILLTTLFCEFRRFG